LHQVIPVQTPDAIRQSAQQALPQATCPPLQTWPHEVPSQVGVEFGVGTWQGVHDWPQVAIELLGTQRPLQAWLPEAQPVAWHWAPAQVNDTPLGHTAHVPPQKR